MSIPAWIQSFPGAITVCDVNGTIVEMNDQAAQVFASSGGHSLIGTDLFACHSEASRQKLRGMMDGQTPNVYTIEKNGQKKLIYQAPWYEDGQFAGFIELSVVIPTEMPHFIRG